MKGIIFTYALTYGGALAALFNPWYGLLIYFCFAIIQPPSLWFWAVPAGNYSRIIAIAVLIGWAARGFGSWNFGRGKPIVFALLGFYGWAVLSAAFALRQDLAWNYVEGLTKIVLPFMVAMTLLNSLPQLKQITWVLFVSQAYVALELNLNYFSGWNRVVLNGFGGMDNNCLSVTMVTGAGLAFFLGLREQIWWRKWMIFVAAALLAHVPMFGMSRGSMLGLVVMGLVTFLLIPKQPKHYLLFALAVAIALRLAGPEVVKRFSTSFASDEDRDASAQSRLDLWKGCWQEMCQSPLVGVGPGNWGTVAVRHGWDEGKRAHSLWFETGAEMGFPGVGCLATFYGLSVWLLWRLARRRELGADWFVGSARMVVASLAGFVVSISFISTWGIELPYYIAFLAAGTLKLADQSEEALTLQAAETEDSPESSDLCETGGAQS